MEPAGDAAETAARGARARHRRGAARRHRGCVSGRSGPRPHRALAREPKSARAGAVGSLSADALAALAGALADGRIRVIDLTRSLAPDFPTIALPPELAQCAPFRLEPISRYDSPGPAWYWNNFSCGEHSGTHFDAPIHWVSGRNRAHNATDTIP